MTAADAEDERRHKQREVNERVPVPVAPITHLLHGLHGPNYGLLIFIECRMQRADQKTRPRLSPFWMTTEPRKKENVAWLNPNHLTQ